MNVLETVGTIVLVLLWFRIIGKTIKALGFHNNARLLDLSNLDWSCSLRYYVSLRTKISMWSIQTNLQVFGASNAWVRHERSTPLILNLLDTYGNLSELYLKKIQKLYKSRGTPFDFWWLQHFFTRNYQFSLHWKFSLIAF